MAGQSVRRPSLACAPGPGRLQLASLAPLRRDASGFNTKILQQFMNQDPQAAPAPHAHAAYERAACLLPPRGAHKPRDAAGERAWQAVAPEPFVLSDIL
jgi:hypothetical protein